MVDALARTDARRLAQDAPSRAEVFAARPVVTAARSVVDELVDAGIDTFFGVPGGPIISVFDAILVHPTARLIEPRQETHGVFEAMGFHRACGRVPAVVVTSGPGATNVVTGVVAAHLERVPMVVLCGDVPWAATGQRLVQQTGGDGIGIERMLTGVTRAVVRIARGESASAQLRTAIDAATDPTCPGPVLVVFSIDASRVAVTPPTIHARPRVATWPALDRMLLQGIASRLQNAERPLVMIGEGARRSAPAVTRLIDALGVPFVTTPQGKGIVSERHPLSLRTCGMAASWWARRYTRGGCDVALVLGTDLDDTSTAGTAPIGDGGYLVHVDTDAQVFARNFPTALAIVHDVASFADQLAAATPSASTRSSAWSAAARDVSAFDVGDFATDDAFPVRPHRVVADIERAAGPEARFVSDIGEHMLFALHYLTSEGQDRFTIHLGLGSMASGICSAVGAALGDASRRVVCICGDGGMQMAGMEILLAIKHRLPVVFVVFNDACYNMVRHGYRLILDGQADFDTPLVDFAAWAEAIGARGRRITRAGEITAGLLDQLTADGLPVVLDVRQDADVRIRGDGRIEAIRQMSMGQKVGRETGPDQRKGDA